ncbi:MAG: energy-coupling factor transporter ATPase [Bacillati bacterium ANGP1]|uniref:Energy-coupling factor transporter ATPase n=1 Tax=Candidatus Segetimicrobium genomatis TaxID=2569760 RepID=A0A537J4Q3_9BACT|nr:MAG: energy-coupling factor transporter ATPase [Terrabacteria group bacterium ANGP1]
MPGTPFQRLALRGISLHVGTGEIVGIIGQTGSGKSTLIQYFNGLMRPLRGRVVIDGHELGGRSVGLAAIRRIVGVVFQDPEEQVFERVLGDDVAYGLRGLPFDAFKDRYTFSLSGGELRKAALAGVLALRPRVLVLDEPTSGLDPGSREDLQARIRAFRDRDGLTLVLVSHDMDEIARLSDRLYVLHDGTVAASGTPREIFGDGPRLAALGLAPPEPTQVLQRLRERGFHVPGDAVTPEEVEQALAALLEGAP